MYPNLNQILKPPAQREGRTMTLTAVMILLIGYLVFSAVRSGATWENDKRLFLLVAVVAASYILAVPLGRLRTRRNVRKSFARFTESQLNRMDMECGDREPLCGIVVTSHALVGEGHLIPIEDIVWIYESSKTQNKGVATINELVVTDKNRKQHRVPMSIKAGPFRKVAPEIVAEIAEQLLKRSPGIYCGYSAAAHLYRRDFAGMAAHVAEKYARLHGR